MIMIFLLLALSLFSLNGNEMTPQEKWQQIVAAADLAAAQARLLLSPEEAVVAEKILLPILKEADINFKAGKRNAQDTMAIIAGLSSILGSIAFGWHLSRENDDLCAPLNIDTQTYPYAKAAGIGGGVTGGLALIAYGYNQTSTRAHLLNLYQIKSQIDITSMQHQQTAAPTLLNWAMPRQQGR
jgi:hypothetical protein